MRLLEDVLRDALRAEAAAKGLTVDADRALKLARAQQRGREFTQTPLALVSFDADRIASDVFATSSPPVVAGASYRLNDLNDQLRARPDAVYSSGGGGLLLVAATAAARARSEVETAFRNEARGLGVTTASVETWPAELFVTDTFQARFRVLQRRLRTAKDAKYVPHEEIPGVAHACELCGQHGASGQPLRFEDGEEVRLCPFCWSKKEIGRRSAIQGRTFEQIACAGRSEARYLALLSLDGNAMGRRLEGVSDLEDLQRFAEGMRDVFEGLQGGLQQRLGADRFLSLLSGGDEIVLILPADRALDTAQWLIAEVESRSRDALHGQPITCGVGVVIAPFRYPIRHLHQGAEELLKRGAKARFYRERGSCGSTVDFAVLTDGSPPPDGILAARSEDLVFGDSVDGAFHLTARPYSAAEFQLFLTRLRTARRAGVATAQLYQLREQAAFGPSVFRAFFRYQAERLPVLKQWIGKETADAFLSSQAADGGRSTWLPDAVEVLDFVPETET